MKTKWQLEKKNPARRRLRAFVETDEKFCEKSTFTELIIKKGPVKKATFHRFNFNAWQHAASSKTQGCIKVEHGRDVVKKTTTLARKIIFFNISSQLTNKIAKCKKLPTRWWNETKREKIYVRIIFFLFLFYPFLVLTRFAVRML